MSIKIEPLARTDLWAVAWDHSSLPVVALGLDGDGWIAMMMLADGRVVPAKGRVIAHIPGGWPPTAAEAAAILTKEEENG